eukprot:Pgem_evm1s11387
MNFFILTTLTLATTGVMGGIIPCLPDNCFRAFTTTTTTNEEKKNLMLRFPDFFLNENDNEQQLLQTLNNWCGLNKRKKYKFCKETDDIVTRVRIFNNEVEVMQKLNEHYKLRFDVPQDPAVPKLSLYDVNMSFEFTDVQTIVVVDGEEENMIRKVLKTVRQQPKAVIYKGKIVGYE